MENFLYSIDVSIFRWINEGWSNPSLTHFFTYITDFNNYYLFIVFFLIYLWVAQGSKGRWLVWSLILAVALSDQFASNVLKILVHRIRPCNALEGVLVPHGMSYSFSFPSSHGTNMGSTMFLLSMAFPAWTPLFVLLALLSGLSRIYLGLHYPSDVLGGYAIGMLIGYGVWKGMEKLRTQLNQPLEDRKGTGTKSTKKTKTNVHHQDAKSAKKGKIKSGI